MIQAEWNSKESAARRSLVLDETAAVPPAREDGLEAVPGGNAPDGLAGQTVAEHIAAEVVERVRRRKAAPRATYRCQFHNGFGFRDAAAIVPYLKSLGISHVYTSPVWRARPGSTHGYDVCSHQEFDPELGGEAGWNDFRAVLNENDVGVLLDVVPNHMSTHAQNLWWNDILENGPSSPFARFFDIDWRPVKPELDGRVMLPVLGRQYGDALEEGELSVTFDAGGLLLCYFDRRLPFDPKTAPLVLGNNLDQLRASLTDAPETLAEYESVLTALDHLPPRTATTGPEVVERQRDKQIIKRRLRELAAGSSVVEQFIAKNIAEINGVPGDPASFDRLDELCAAQVYRLCHWKAAGDEVNYRRFFDINELAALCIEDPEAFYQTHRLVMRLLADGAAAGLRIDHIDGLYAPEQYLWRLQWGYIAELVNRELEEESAENGAQTCTTARQDSHATAASPYTSETREASAPVAPVDLAASTIVEVCRRLGIPSPSGDDWGAILGRTVELSQEKSTPAAPLNVSAMTAQQKCFVPLFVVVEKILGPHEPLPETWPVAGTTGYDFLQMCDGLFLPDDGWRQLKRDYARIVNDSTPFEEVAQESKKLILSVAMAGELQMLAHRLNRISEQHRRTRDFTLNMLRLALREILVCFPVYRIYPGPLGISDRDRHFVAVAVAMAKRRNPAIDASVFDFARDVLLLAHPAGLSAEAIHERELFAGRFQQVTSPVMAKGVEDTTFYVYGPLLSVNEVGNKPEAPVISPAEFHAWNEQRAHDYPQAMLASSTHDTKRSEDVRARLNVLAEVPRAWRTAVQRWMRFARRRRVEVDGLPAPSRGDEYHFYQSLIGIWPISEDVDERDLAERMSQYMDKAGHEAKQRTSWINPNEPYDRAMQNFVTGMLDPRRDNRFLADLRKWQRPLATLGLVNALAELTLKFTSPGFPDIYQGQECWAFRLVDPDNRQPVDFATHERLLGDLRRLATDPGQLRSIARDLAANLADPRAKLFVTWRLLELRHRLMGLLSNAHRYVPLHVTGTKAEHVVAYARLTEEYAAEGEPAGARQAMIVVVPRLVARLVGWNPDVPATQLVPCGEEIWGDTRIDWPSDINGTFDNVLTGVSYNLPASVSLAELLADFPVAVLAHG